MVERRTPGGTPAGAGARERGGVWAGGPIARPAPGPAVVSRVHVQVIPLGRVRYDGQVLPLISPDGRYLAVQDGESPTWETLLAEPGGETPANTVLTVYDLSSVPLKRVAWDVVLSGLVLGRAADGRGFLVEWPRADGSRWIGRARWETGEIEWQASDERVNAHAMLMEEGWLLFTRRGVDERASVLVLRTPDGHETVRVPEQGSYLFPVAGSGRGVVYVLRGGAGALEIEAIRVLQEDGPVRFGRTLARGVLAYEDSALVAYQAMASTQGLVAEDGQRGLTTGAGAERGGGKADPPMLFHPAMGRMVLFDARTGTFAGLAARSVAACAWRGGGTPGYLCTTPDGLTFVPAPPLPGGADPARSRSVEATVRVLAGPFVPRATISPECPVILVGPAGREPDLLDVAVLRPGASP